MTNIWVYIESSFLLVTHITSKHTIQVYAPTSEEEVDEFYSQIKTLIKKLPKQKLLILVGDFNTKIGKGRGGKHIGPHRLGARYVRGQTLSIFGTRSTSLPDRRLYTWTSSRDNEEDYIIRNQIDYILVNQKYINSDSGTTIHLWQSYDKT